jgi:DNA-directed RNA polymerase subunit RPC12/RpoP
MTKIAIQKTQGIFCLSCEAIVLIKTRYPDWYNEIQSENLKMNAYEISRHVKRDDPRLIEIIEELGDKCSKVSGEIQIAEISNDEKDWHIKDYNGLEWVSSSRVLEYSTDNKNLGRLPFE